jgi:hypothetical protein
MTFLVFAVRFIARAFGGRKPKPISNIHPTRKPCPPKLTHRRAVGSRYVCCYER